MFTAPHKSRQPLRIAWSCECLLHKRTITLGHSFDNSTLHTYNSHLQSYLSFCKLHKFSLKPTADTLSFYIVFMCHHIKPNSVTQYLSSIISSLKPHFPDIRKCHNNLIILHTLAGMKKLR